MALSNGSLAVLQKTKKVAPHIPHNWVLKAFIQYTSIPSWEHILPMEKKNHLPSYPWRGYVSSLEGKLLRIKHHDMSQGLNSSYWGWETSNLKNDGNPYFMGPQKVTPTDLGWFSHPHTIGKQWELIDIVIIIIMASAAGTGTASISNSVKVLRRYRLTNSWVEPFPKQYRSQLVCDPTFYWEKNMEQKHVFPSSIHMFVVICRIWIEWPWCFSIFSSQEIHGCCRGLGVGQSNNQKTLEGTNVSSISHRFFFYSQEWLDSIFHQNWMGPYQRTPK